MILHDQQLRLTALRRSLGLTQTELAARMGVPQSTISRWERKGSLHAASMERLAMLAGEHERKHAKDLPALRVVAAELAFAILELKLDPVKHREALDGLARQVLTVIQSQLTHSQ